MWCSVVDENSIKPTWGARECWGSCLGNNIHSDFIICICAVQNLTVLQVESKFKSKGIFSTMVDVFNLCWFHTVVYSHLGVPLESWNFFLI